MSRPRRESTARVLPALIEPTAPTRSRSILITQISADRVSASIASIFAPAFARRRRKSFDSFPSRPPRRRLARSLTCFRRDVVSRVARYFTLHSTRVARRLPAPRIARPHHLPGVNVSRSASPPEIDHVCLCSTMSPASALPSFGLNFHVMCPSYGGTRGFQGSFRYPSAL